MKIQLCYASQYAPHEQSDLLQDLNDIFLTARQFNNQHHIHGVLYYAQGQFFQCLEGEQSILEELFEKIAQDPRHTQIIRFANQPIQRVHFMKWSMKYVKTHSKILNFFKQLGLDSFQPSALNDVQRVKFLNLLYKAKNHRLRQITTTPSAMPLLQYAG